MLKGVNKKLLESLNSIYNIKKIRLKLLIKGIIDKIQGYYNAKVYNGGL